MANISNMAKRLTSPPAYGGYGTIIITIVIFFAQGGFGKMTPLTSLYIIGLVIGIGLILYSVLKTASSNTKQSSVSLSSQIKDLLLALHKRDLILKIKAKKQYTNLFSGRDFRQFLDKFSRNPVIITEEKQLKKIERQLKGKYLDKDDTQARKQIDGLFTKVMPVIDIDSWSLEKINQAGHLISQLPRETKSVFRGIDKLRETDKKWQQLFGQLTTLEANNPRIFTQKIQEDITEYISRSFGGCSLWLLTDLVEYYVPSRFLPSDYLSSDAQSPTVVIEDRMAKCLNKIVKLMESEENKNGQ